MRVRMHNDDANWLKWGQLVDYWINHPEVERPNTVGKLRGVLAAAGVCAEVDGPADRPVEIKAYGNPAEQPLLIHIPDKTMLDKRKGEMTPAGEYELPKFYDLAFPKCQRASMTPRQKEEFRLRRVGEYTVNECC